MNRRKYLGKKARTVEFFANLAVHRDFVLTPIVIESILDKVILHEMTHTIVWGASRNIDESSLLKIRYGWRRCRDMAKEGETSRTSHGQQNADGIAHAAFGKFTLGPFDEAESFVSYKISFLFVPSLMTTS